ncbi:hypothetical protein Pfo_005493 [Paulownia fortunei]|nr:hypothetical protein Pfo_005493 [Paulownia fortunei]
MESRHNCGVTSHRHRVRRNENIEICILAFKPCIDGFQNCRKAISVDGTHLYTKYKHKLLIAVGIDANQQVLPLAFAVVDEEAFTSWRWFLHMLSMYVVRGIEGVFLSRQATNRSESVFAGAVDRTLTVRHAGAPFWSFHGGEGALHPRVVHMMYDMGFYGVYQCGHFDMDFHLIIALVERWRPENHTFHFRIGEVTVTLQDVAVIWGLPVDGQPVIGVDPRRSTEHALRGYLEANPVTDDTPHDELERYARGCALILLGSIMCPDSSGNGVSLLYLQSMKQIKDVVYFSWGSAVLSFMYRELCNASDKDKNVIGGAMVLLQFIWEPYDMSSSDIMVLGPRCNIPLWRSRCPLINYAIMEFHHPERVMRQYIPPDIPAYEHTLHDVDRRGRNTARRTMRRTRVVDDAGPSTETWGAFTSHVSTSYDIPHPLMSSVADEACLSTLTHHVSHGLDSTADYYVPQQAQPDDSFTPYWGMPPSTMSFSTLLTSDLDMAQTPFIQQHIGYDSRRGDFTVSPIAFPHLDSDYHDRGESTSITSSDQSHDIAAAQGGRRGRRQRQRRTCGTGGHF